MLIDDSGRLLGKFNVIDAGIGALLLLATLGIIAVQSGWHQTSGQMIEGEADIEYTVFMRNIKTLNPNLFEPGKTLSMTIRNQPRGAVEIVRVQHAPKKALLANGQVVDDKADPYGYDYLLTVKDHATITSDGYVTAGVKVKVGMNIEVEGFNYRLPAYIVDIKKL